MISLRHYQEAAKGRIYQNFKEGRKKSLIGAATGSGKSVLFSAIAKDCHNHGMNIVLIVRRRELIKQASAHFDKWGIDHGVYMANHYRKDPSKKAQICSVDTLRARDLHPYADQPGNTVLIIDEAHDCSSKTYKNIFENYRQCYIIGLTATPFRDNSIWDDYFCPIEPWELRDQGFLTPERIFVPNVIDVTGVRTDCTGDYNKKELYEVCARNEVVGNAIRDWNVYGKGRRTVLFAVNVDHSMDMCRELNKAGIRAMHCDASTKSAERDRAITALKKHEIDILCNVNVFSTGVDIPEIECISFLRPTQSVIYWLQAIGRGLRPAPHINKKDCIIIDHAGNTFRHGGPYIPRDVNLEKKGSGTIAKEASITIRTCDTCFFVYEGKDATCPMCGHINTKKERRIETVDGELVEYSMTEDELEQVKQKAFISDYFKLKSIAKFRNMQDNWVWFTLIDRHDGSIIRKYGHTINFPRAYLTKVNL